LIGFFGILDGLGKIAEHVMQAEQVGAGVPRRKRDPLESENSDVGFGQVSIRDGKAQPPFDLVEVISHLDRKFLGGNRFPVRDPVEETELDSLDGVQGNSALNKHVEEFSRKFLDITMIH
jgi:hypothetical protein